MKISRFVKSFSFFASVLLLTAGSVYAVNAALTFSSTGVTSDGDLQIVFEGTTANDFETTLTAVDPTVDRTITLPDAGGVLVVDTVAQTLTNKTLTSPKIGTSILDTNGNELSIFSATSNAINELTIANAGINTNPTITASGDDTNVGIDVATKGTGNLQVTLAASSLMNVLTGNLKVGNGTPDVTLNGEDAYIEGTLEVDGSVRFDSNPTISGSAGLINMTADESGQSPASGVGTVDVNMQTRTAKIPVTFSGANDFDFTDGADVNVGRKIFTFPAGNIVVRSVTYHFTSVSTTGLTDPGGFNTFYTFAIGTTGTTGTSANLQSPTTLSNISNNTVSSSQAGATIFSSQQSNQTVAISGSSDVYFNVGVANSVINAGNGTMALTGNILIAYDVY